MLQNLVCNAEVRSVWEMEAVQPAVIVTDKRGAWHGGLQ